MGRGNQLRIHNTLLIPDHLRPLPRQILRIKLTPPIPTTILLLHLTHRFIRRSRIHNRQGAFGAVRADGVEDGFAGGEFPDGVGLVGVVDAVAGARVQPPHHQFVVFAGRDEA